jgi:hypothetical protein
MGIASYQRTARDRRSVRPEADVFSAIIGRGVIAASLDPNATPPRGRSDPPSSEFLAEIGF